ncbi:MAG: hypothetical protein KatS3mg002_0271 [Candidatus Woesearchaeota archaeon]|nr:MAG: hypothetical protein KatS3mg002_0271 [Candidatus Woesearchaeota archaeon]
MYNELKESITFMSIARETVANILEANNADRELIDYVINEASDYQIMSLLVNDKMPEEKFNFTEEQKVFNRFKQIVAENANTLSHLFGFNTVYNLIENVNPLSPHGLSTAKPILEHYMALQEQAPGDFTPDKLARVRGMAKQVYHAVSDKVSDLKDKLPEIRDKLNQMFDKGYDNASGFLNKVKEFAQANRGGVAIGGAVLAALVAYGLYRIYKNRKNKALQACKDKPGEAKKLCIKNFEKKALQDQIKGLQSAKAMCKTAKNPEKCAAALEKKIAKLQKKMAKV